MTKEERELTITYLKDMQEEYIEGEGYERHPLPEWYALYKAIEVLEQTRWIPVNEKLPEDGKQVLCCNKYGSVFTSELTWSKGYLMFGQHFDVIAWMPLPEPYQKGEKNEHN